MAKALILGCSHAAGSEMHNGVNKSYPVLLSQKMGLLPDNQSIPGGSNDAMYRIFEHYVDVKKITNTDVVIACWTGSTRTEVQYDQQWQPLAQGIQHSKIVNYYKQWMVYDTDHWKWRLNKIKNIIALNTIAKKIGIHVVNVFSFDMIEGYKPIDLYKEFYWPAGTTCFTNWCLEQGYEHTAGGHFSEVAHIEFSKLLL